MPLGIVIVEFDRNIGGEIFFKHPEEFEVDDKYIQQITISHNFVSSIMITRDNVINALSFYNEEHEKTFVIFLNQREDGQDYYEIIKQLDGILLKDLPEEVLFEEIKDLYNLSCSIINVREEVMLKFANEISEMKGIEHDFRKRLEKLMEISQNTEIKILLALTLKESQTINELYATEIKGKRTTFNNALDRLIEKKLVRKFNNDTVRINI
jgi:hypothetical protein